MVGKTPINEYLFTRAIPEPNTGCFIWLGEITHSGYPYGQAYKRAFELNGGAVPKGLELDHVCRVRCCINPDHLKVVTKSENMRRAIGVGKFNKNKTHCKHGHSLEDAYKLKNGARKCRSCDKIWRSTPKARMRNTQNKALWCANNRARYNATARAWKARKKDSYV